MIIVQFDGKNSIAMGLSGRERERERTIELTLIMHYQLWNNNKKHQCDHLVCQTSNNLRISFIFKLWPKCISLYIEMNNRKLFGAGFFLSRATHFANQHNEMKPKTSKWSSIYWQRQWRATNHLLSANFCACCTISACIYSANLSSFSSQWSALSQFYATVKHGDIDWYAMLNCMPWYIVSDRDQFSVLASHSGQHIDF